MWRSRCCLFVLYTCNQVSVLLLLQWKIILYFCLQVLFILQGLIISCYKKLCSSKSHYLINRTIKCESKCVVLFMYLWYVFSIEDYCLFSTIFSIFYYLIYFLSIFSFANKCVFILNNDYMRDTFIIVALTNNIYKRLYSGFPKLW